MHQAFISHSTKDQKFAQAMCQALEQAGVKAWIAPRDIPAAAEYDDALVDAIEQTEIVVLVLSEAAKASRHVKTEIALAQEEGKKFIPIRLEKVLPTKSMRYAIGTAQYLDAFNQPQEEVGRQLATAARRLLGLPDQSPKIDIVRRPEQEPRLEHRETRTPLYVYLLACSGLVAMVLLSLFAMLRGGNQTAEPHTTPPIDQATQARDQVAAEDRQKLEAIDKRLQLAKATDVTQASALFSSLTRDRETLQGLITEWDSHPEHDLATIAKKHLTTCERTIRQLEAAIAEDKARKALRRLGDSVDNPEGFAATLNSIATTHEKAAIAEGLRSVASEENNWKAILSWSALYESDTYKDPSRHTPKAIRKLNVDAASLPMVSSLTDHYQERKSYFQKLAARRDGFASNVSLTARLRKDLGTLRMRDLYVVQTKDGRLLYMRNDPNDLEPNRRGNYEFKVMVNDIDLAKPEELPAAGVVIPPEARAPHCRLARAIVTTLDQNEQRLDTEWVAVFTELIPKVIEAEGIDPIPHYLICKGLLEVASQGSESIDRAFKEHREQLGQANFNPLVNWLNDKANGVKAERRQCQEALSGLPPTADAVREAERLLASFRSVSVPRTDWIGWLDQDAVGEWRLVNTRGAGNGALHVVFPAGASRSRLQRVGVLRDGRSTWSPAATGLKLGRPVFLQD